MSIEVSSDSASSSAADSGTHSSAQIREATLADIPALTRMGLAFLRTSGYRSFVRENPAQIAVLAERLITTQGVVLLAERHGVAVGMIGLVAGPHFISGDLFVGEVIYWIEPTARGLGVRLLRAAERWAAAYGALTMQMISPNARVDALYERFGYQPVERTFQRTVGVPPCL